MNNDQGLDQKIARLVRKVENDLPAVLEERVRSGVEDLHQSPGRAGRHRFWLLALIPGAAAAVLAAVLISPLLRRPTVSPISEIRTEFEIAGKNIKIIFFQTPDFRLFQEDSHE